MGKIDPNHDIVPTLRMMGGLLFDKAADEIDLLREAYRAAVRRPATELMVVGPGWHERFPVTTTPIVIDGLLQVHVSDRRDDMAAELARLRAENERLRIELENASDVATQLRGEVALYRGESEKFRALLNYVPLPPVAITYERGWKLIDMLQAAAIAQEKP